MPSRSLEKLVKVSEDTEGTAFPAPGESCPTPYRPYLQTQSVVFRPPWLWAAAFPELRLQAAGAALLGASLLRLNFHSKLRSFPDPSGQLGPKS